MPTPLIREYIDSLTQPTHLFRTLSNFEVVRDVYGEPFFISGGNSVIFKVIIDGKLCALKCFTRQISELNSVMRYISDIKSTIVCDVKYLPEEIYVYDNGVTGNWYDVALMSWSEGRTLEFEMRKAIHQGDSVKLASLANNFDKLAVELLDQEWAHGDIKPENIMVLESGDMILIDFESLYAPTLVPRNQIGTPYFQHPLRDENFYNKHIDDYPIALISSLLHALSLDISLMGKHKNQDNLILIPCDIIAGESECYSAILDLFAREGEAKLLRLCQTLASAQPSIKEIKYLLTLNGIKSTTKALKTFREGHLWGYCNDKGECVIEPIFDSALEFKSGLARVKIGSYDHIIDITGKIVK